LRCGAQPRALRCVAAQQRALRCVAVQQRAVQQCAVHCVAVRRCDLRRRLRRQLIVPLHSDRTHVHTARQSHAYFRFVDPTLRRIDAVFANSLLCHSCAQVGVGSGGW
jgi:hypothetical protein